MPNPTSVLEDKYDNRPFYPNFPNTEFNNPDLKGVCSESDSDSDSSK